MQRQQVGKWRRKNFVPCKRKDPEKEELSIQSRLEELEEENPRGILYPKLSLSHRR